MIYREIGQSGIKASVVGLGTWVLGGGGVWGKSTPGKEDAQEILHTALDMGINLVDTAPLFGFGQGESLLAEVLKLRRDDIILSTRCGITWEEKTGLNYGTYDGKTIYLSLSPKSIQSEIQASLKRLGTDFIDIYHAHWKSALPTLGPIEDIIACLNSLKDKGLIRSFGFSNVNLDQVKAWHAIQPIDAIQNRYSMLNREMEQDLLPWTQTNSISVIACMPLYQGLLTGRISPKKKFGPEELRGNPAINPWFKPESCKKIHKQLLLKWIPIAEKYRCSIAQLVIAWTFTQPGLTHVLCGASNPKQAKENAAAGNLEIKEEDLEQINWDIEVLGEPG